MTSSSRRGGLPADKFAEYLKQHSFGDDDLFFGWMDQPATTTVATSTTATATPTTLAPNNATANTATNTATNGASLPFTSVNGILATNPALATDASTALSTLPLPTLPEGDTSFFDSLRTLDDFSMLLQPSSPSPSDTAQGGPSGQGPNAKRGQRNKRKPIGADVNGAKLSTREKKQRNKAAAERYRAKKRKEREELKSLVDLLRGQVQSLASQLNEANMEKANLLNVLAQVRAQAQAQAQAQVRSLGTTASSLTGNGSTTGTSISTVTGTGTVTATTLGTSQQQNNNTNTNTNSTNLSSYIVSSTPMMPAPPNMLNPAHAFTPQQQQQLQLQQQLIEQLRKGASQLKKDPIDNTQAQQQQQQQQQQLLSMPMQTAFLPQYNPLPNPQYQFIGQPQPSQLQQTQQLQQLQQLQPTQQQLQPK